MVVTRSQGEAAEAEEQRRAAERKRQEEDARRELQRISLERLRRKSLEPPASPSLQTKVGATEAMMTGESSSAIPRAERRTRSPARSACSHKSTASVNARLRLAELEAAEKLAALKRKELEIEAELIKKRLAADVSAIQEEEVDEGGTRERVDEWLRSNPLTREEDEPRRLRFDTPGGQSPTPTKSKTGIEQLAESLEKMARPRLRHTDLPSFTGSPNKWLPFKAAMNDTTKMYNVTPAENLQRLRSCLKGEARDSVAALLYTATNSGVIMQTLERCYGRPEVIIDRALDDLRKMPRLGSTAAELNTFAIKLQNVICVLQTIDRKGYLYNPLMAREILEKLSPHIRSRWCDYASDYEGTADPEIVVLSRFLTREADRALRYTYVPQSAATTTTAAKKEVKATTSFKRKPNAVYNTNETAEKEKCPSCNDNHQLPQCPKYKKLSIYQRWEFLKEKRICFKCIKGTHRRIKCRAKPCGVNECRRPHHSTLHQEETNKEASTSSEAVLSVAVASNNKQRSVLLKMCPVVISGPRGEVKTYALLDEGATITLVDEQLANQVGAKGPSQPLHMRGVNMTQKETNSKLVSLTVRGKHEQQEHQLRARTIKGLKLHQQSIPEVMMEHEHLKDLRMDEVCYDLARPGILVGSDHWECIVSRELRVGEPNQPAASRTQLGWVLHGTVPRSIIMKSERVLHVYERTDEKERSDQQLHNLVEKHFKIEALGVALQPRANEAEQRAIEIVTKTIKKIDSGYEVALPWREDNVTMPPTFDMALRRLKTIEKKMDASPEFKKEYSAQIDNLLEKGYAIPCDGSERASAVCWYLPHFAVTNPNKPGKQRLVFDAAAKSHGLCLNDFLLEGPDLLLSLPGILFRFREKEVAVTADIQEMFLRVKIRPEDQPAQQFLWRGSDRNNPPRHYKMASMIFGAASSPFMAHFVRNHNANIHASRYPKAQKAITESHYMDDLVASYDSEHEARSTVNEIITVHANAGFKLRGWNPNKEEVLRDIPTELRATVPTQLGGAQPENKILGLYWNAEQDELGFNTSMNRVPADVRSQVRSPTKREALSAVMSIYDPLGLLSHYTIRAKIILQSLWRLKTSWDEPLPIEEAELFAEWLSHLTEIAHLRLPRLYMPGDYQHIELHVLCDASEQAYATVAYWRVTHSNGDVKVILVAAKSKVAPKRTQTIPRLELQAAVIGARLASTIKREHEMAVEQTTYWTDSSTVVNWIRHDTKKYTPFVAHRLGEIAELTNKDEWRWLPTDSNVADDATRFSYAPISGDDRWLHGPSFLYEPKEHWPTDRTLNEIEEEEVLHTCEDPPQHQWLPDPAKFSKYETLVRAAARVLAFADICRRNATQMEHRHVERAERELLRQSQRESFGNELQRMKSARPLTKTSRLYKLDPILEDGILKVLGRIDAATAPIETKQPIILDGRHRITKLLVMKEHCAAGHANRERVTNDLRQRYWIIHLRPTVRAVQRDCTYCQVRKAKPQPPATGDLPKARIDPFHRPFSNCGVDYFGPMMVKLGRRREKRWGALFTCLTTRAVHIELVSSLSTDSAIMALRRMAARRGWPTLMYSDNATNFHGADQELRAAYTEWLPALRDEGLLHRLEWRYIPPGAPNQGGAWERLVRSVKTALAVTLREKEPTEEILRTLLTEAEFSINARPLTHVSVNPYDPEALTPNHFLLGSSMGLPTTGSCDEADRRAWRASQALADHFWQRWLKEYLPTLVPRGEPKNDRRPLRVGDVVAVADNTLPRNVWPLGVVERTYTGPDGGIRVADVRTRTGIFKRPVSKLIVLEKEEATQAAPGGEM